tara:strand:+ start:3005 stop:4081 length:1077 start_codon:yes stop_codon:yes gene_type:complete
MTEFNYKNYLQSHLLDIDSYEALSYPEELADFIKLDGNENPYGPSDNVIKALAQLEDLQLYPNSTDLLKQKIADSLDVLTDNIVCGAGADAVISLIVSSLNKETIITTMTPTFAMYKHDAFMNNLGFIEIDFGEISTNLSEGYIFDLPSPPQQQDVFIFASPNNPTGQIINRDSVIRILDQGSLVIIDEAYIKFSKHESYVELTKKYDNLIVIQTFSKWAGLAGLRIGYAIMNKSFASTLNAIQQPYTITNYAMNAAIQSLEDTKFLEDNITKIINTRDTFIKQLVDISSITAIPSEGNFVLLKLSKGSNEDFYKYMYDKKILIRTYSDDILSKYVRISIGTTEHMQKVFKAIEEWDK